MLASLIVYLANNPAAALLEVCVHTSASDVPPDFTLLKVDGPDGGRSLSLVGRACRTIGGTLRPLVTRDLGTAWLRSKRKRFA